MRKQVKVYTPLVRYERILYSLLDVELPFPVSFRQIGFFASSLLAMVILVKLPGFGFMESWWLINYVAIPVGLTWFFTKFKLDGKAPHIFLLNFIQYQLSAKTYSKYEKAEKPAKYQYKTNVTYRKGADSE